MDSYQKLPDIRSLVVEAGFAAVNLGMREEMKTILAALPNWIDDAELLAHCEAVLLFGLKRKKAAQARLDTLPANDCAALRALLTTPPPHSH
jgi:type III secretion system SsaH family protein